RRAAAKGRSNRQLLHSRSITKPFREPGSGVQIRSRTKSCHRLCEAEAMLAGTCLQDFVSRSRSTIHLLPQGRNLIDTRKRRVRSSAGGLGKLALESPTQNCRGSLLLGALLPDALS